MMEIQIHRSVSSVHPTKFNVWKYVFQSSCSPVSAHKATINIFVMPQGNMMMKFFLSFFFPVQFYSRFMLIICLLCIECFCNMKYFNDSSYSFHLFLYFFCIAFLRLFSILSICWWVCMRFFISRNSFRDAKQQKKLSNRRRKENLTIELTTLVYIIIIHTLTWITIDSTIKGRIHLIHQMKNKIASFISGFFSFVLSASLYFYSYFNRIVVDVAWYFWIRKSFIFIVNSGEFIWIHFTGARKKQL